MTRARIKTIFWGPVEEMKDKEFVITQNAEIHIIPFPFIEGLRGDYVLIIAIFEDEDYEENDA